MSRAAVLPVDDAYSTVRGGQDVVGPQAAVTGLKHLRRLDPGLGRDQLIEQIGQSAGERHSRLEKLLDQTVPAVGANQFVIPGVQRAQVSGWNADWRPRPPTRLGWRLAAEQLCWAGSARAAVFSPGSIRTSARPQR